MVCGVCWVGGGAGVDASIVGDGAQCVVHLVSCYANAPFSLFDDVELKVVLRYSVS